MDFQLDLSENFYQALESFLSDKVILTHDEKQKGTNC
jgi:hypothetical protein